MKKLSCLLLALLLTLTPLAGGIVLPTAADDTAPKITPAPHAYAQGLAAWYRRKAKLAGDAGHLGV